MNTRKRSFPLSIYFNKNRIHKNYVHIFSRDTNVIVCICIIYVTKRYTLYYVELYILSYKWCINDILCIRCRVIDVASDTKWYASDTRGQICPICKLFYV